MLDAPVGALERAITPEPKIEPQRLWVGLFSAAGQRGPALHREAK